MRKRRVRAMLKNNNGRIVGRMAKSALRGSRGRSLILLTAIALSSFMLFSVLTVGVTYFKMWRLQNLRLSGAEFDALLYGCTEEQMDKLEENPEIVRIGIFALAGGIAETDRSEVAEIPLAWVDDVYWEQMAKPARTFFEGRYPTAEDELLVTEKALKMAGEEGCGIGDSFLATWVDRDGQKHTENFRICGIWDGYGTKSHFYVSRAFYDKSGYQISDTFSGRIHFDLRQKLLTKRQKEALIGSLNLGKAQRIIFDMELAYSIPIYLGLAGLVAATCLCAYLLIYNIMYLSVTGNIRYYGLLQTIGMTGRQIRGFIYRQMLFLGGLGIAAGMLAGFGVSFLVLPSLIQALGISQRAEVDFEPAVFVLTIAITASTVYVGSRKPAKLAARVSPIEASRYQSAQAGARRRAYRTGGGNILWRMGGRKAVKEKQKTAVIAVSLSVGMSVFLCVLTLVESQGPRTIMSNAWGSDMEVTNITLRADEREKWKELFTEEVLERLEAVEGVRSVYTTETAEVMIPWEEDFVGPWMKEMYESFDNENFESEQAEYRKNPEMFRTYLVGIDEECFSVLNETLDEPIDEEDFQKGKTCVLFRNTLAYQTKDLRGKTVSAAEYGNAGNSFCFAIAGLTDSTEFLGQKSGMLPTVIISKQALEDLGLTTYQYRASIFYEKEYDEAAEAAVHELLEGESGGEYFRFESKLESMQEMKAAQGSMLEVGIGISLILALIGIMNYINTVVGNIESRQKELAILEGIGMTQRQINRMLVREGAIYAIFAVLLTGIFGLPVTYLLYQMLNYMAVPFVVPTVWVLAVLFAVFVVCTGVPLVILRCINRRGTVIERILERVSE